MKLLIVDDEARIRALIAKYAAFEGYETEEAENGMQAIEKCREKHYDLIIMDVMMPELDGFSAVREIRKHDSVPVIMLSARGEEYDRIHGFELGIDDYVVKPFSPKELMMRVGAVLKRSGEAAKKEDETITVGGITVDFTARRVLVDGKEVESSYFSTNSWSRNETGITDGEHLFKLVVKDSAGLVSDTAKITFYVYASLITLSIDGKTSKMVNSSQSITFTAKVENAIPMPDSLIWETNITGAETFRTKVNQDDSVATIIISKDSLPTDIETGIFYTMQAKSKDGIASNTVRFGFFDDGPVVYFEIPANDTSVSINDVIPYTIFADGNNTDPDNKFFTLAWDCDGGTPCPTDNSLNGSISWSTPGKKTFTVSITNSTPDSRQDILHVNVVSDPPTIQASSESMDNRHKINSPVDLNVSASDKYGFIQKISWGCTNGTMVTFDYDTTFTDSPKSITNVPITVLMPGTICVSCRA